MKTKKQVTKLLKKNLTRKRKANKKLKSCSLKTTGKYDKIYKKLNGKGLNIGMITVPLSPDKQFFQVCGDSYIASSHISWLKRYGVNIIPIPWSTKKFDYYMKICMDFIFQVVELAGTQKEYYNCCKTFSI